jgi:hypothetical protein
MRAAGAKREILMLLLRSILLLVTLLAAQPAVANWFESGFVNIVANLSPAEAEDIDPGDVIDSVVIGSEAESGELTVVSEGDVTTRQSLGQWTVRNGQGNIQSTFGTGGPLTVATGNYLNPTSPELEVLNSDIVGNCGVGREGTLRLIASVIDDLQVGEAGSAYLSMGSRAEIVSSESGTGTGKYLQLDASSIVGRALQYCRLFDVTLLARDSLFACAYVDLSNGTDAQFRPEQTPYSEIRIQQALRITASDIDVQGGIASTGRLELTGSLLEPTSLAIAATRWVNEGDLTVGRSDLGPAELVLSGGTRFLQRGTATIATAGSDGLAVSGAGTELEIEEDLIVGPFSLPGTLTVGSGAEVIVHGTFTLGPQAVLNLNAGGTIYAAAAEIEGTVNENGGTLVVPEPGAAASGMVVLVVLAWRSRTVRTCRD